jgi:hypothetical protein
MVYPIKLFYKVIYFSLYNNGIKIFLQVFEIENNYNNYSILIYVGLRGDELIIYITTVLFFSDCRITILLIVYIDRVLIYLTCNKSGAYK